MNYLVLDIETVPEPVPQSRVDEWRKELEAEYVKPETVVRKLEDKVSRSRFDFDGSRPICLGMCVLSGHGPELTESYSCVASQDSRDIAMGFAEATTGYLPLKLVGFNLKKFDLPILFRWLHLSGVKLNHQFGRYDVIDLIEHVAGPGQRVSLERACNAYGIETSKSDGSMVEGWYIAKAWDQIKAYCLEDIASTVKLFNAVRSYVQL